ncbi:MAG TPA: T9SS type A sorting domain-containing protein [Rhodothermales bacterium]|nr:T9SS type A sorting domain-containing protein [Rhodothermales bacterium]HRR08269.1 T9SS type A sorting domain-containing protein [Rhodothermales bacterium]
MNKIFTTLLLLLANVNTYAQLAKFTDFPTLDLLQNADAALRGKVLSAHSEWEADRNIYTTFQIEVDEWYKGALRPQVYTFKQRGGVVGDQAQIGSHLADFQPKEEVVIFLKNGGVWAGAAGKYAIQENYVMEEKLAVHDFDKMVNQMVNAPKARWHSIYNQFEIKRVDLEARLNKSLAVAITSFTPTTSTGGTGSMVTINGSGFGATKGTGKVEFTKQATSGGATFAWQLAEIVSWSDTVIRALVPAGASSGKIRVTDNAASSATSATNLTLTYGLDSRKWPGTPASVTYMINGSSISGTDNADVSNARTAVENAIDTWNNMLTTNNIPFSFVKGGTTTATAIGNNDTNEIVFNGASFTSGAGGTLAVNWNWFSTTTGIISESDIDFDNADNWDDSGSPSSGEQDIETVALHELGHTTHIYDYYNQQLDNTKVMYGFSASGTTKRTLHSSEAEALKGLYGFTGQTTSLAGGDDLDLASGDNNYYAVGGITEDATTFDLGLSNANFTIEAWIRPTAYPSSGNVGIIAAKSKLTSDRSYEFVLNSAGKLEFRLSADGTSVTTITSTATIALNTWTHVMAVFDNASNNAMLIAINGAMDTNTFFAFTTNVYNSSGNFVVGGTHNGTSVVGEFAGAIDELRVLNSRRVTLTSSSPLTFSTYALPNSRHTDSVTLGFWKFGDSSGAATHLSKTSGAEATYYDRSGNEGHLQLVSSPLAVGLTSFVAAVQKNEEVLLEWETASETNNAGFEVEHRTRENEAFKKIGFVQGNGTTVQQSHYTFQIPKLQYGKHTFRLVQVDHDGTRTYSPTVEASIELQDRFFLSEAYPNPFNPSTTFALAVGQTQNVQVRMFDLLGREVKLLHNGHLDGQTTHTFSFNAQGLASGKYLLRVQGENFVASKMITLVK